MPKFGEEEKAKDEHVLILEGLHLDVRHALQYSYVCSE